MYSSLLACKLRTKVRGYDQYLDPFYANFSGPGFRVSSPVSGFSRPDFWFFGFLEICSRNQRNRPGLGREVANLDPY